MKKNFIFLFLSFLSLNFFIYCSEVCAPTVTNITQGNFGSGNKTPYVISTPGNYVLTTDIIFTPTGPANAININTNGVTLDFNGKTLTQGNSVPNCNGVRIAGSPASSPKSDVNVQGRGVIKSFTNAGITAGNPTVSTISACSRIKISDINVFDCKIRGIEFAGSAIGSISDVEISNCSISKSCSSVSADYALFGNYCEDLKIKNLSIHDNDATSANFTGCFLQNCNLCKLNSVRIFLNHGTVFQGINLRNTQNCALTNCIAENNGSTSSQILFIANAGANIFENCVVKDNIEGSIIGFNISSPFNLLKECKVLSNSTSSGSFTGIVFTGGTFCSSNNLYDCLVSNNSSNNTCIGFDLKPNTVKNALEKCVAFSNLSTGNLSNSNCYGFNLDQTTNCILKSCRASQNESTSDGVTNICAGFNISSTGGAGTGVKNCQFIGCTAIQNDGFNDARSYGIRAISSANGNQNNYFVKNMAMGNGRNNPIEANQIIITKAGDSKVGGVSVNSIESTSINRLNNLKNNYSNVIISG